jgi:hypothetical protein
MSTRLFRRFLASSDTLQAYKGRKLLFASNKGGLLPLLEYINCRAYQPGAVIFDLVMGNAAALLAVKARCREVYSPLGSQLAIGTLAKYGISHHLTGTVPYIKKPDGSGMCPMENLSIGRGPEEFYKIIKNTVRFPEGGTQ